MMHKTTNQGVTQCVSQPRTEAANISILWLSESLDLLDLDGAKLCSVIISLQTILRWIKIHSNLTLFGRVTRSGHQYHNYVTILL